MEGTAVSAAHTFHGTDGSGPWSGVVEASDGRLYGATQSGGANTYGTLFRMTTGAAAFTTLWNFHGTDGGHPKGPLVEASDGAIYGTSSGGFLFGEGMIFRWLLAPASPAISAIWPTSGPSSGRTAVQIRGSHFQTAPVVTLGGAAALGTLGLDAQTVAVTSPALAPGSLNTISLTNPDATKALLPAAWFADFLDLGSESPFHDSVEAIARARITAGCGGGNYCGLGSVTRAQMAVFLLKAEHGSNFVPPSCTGLFTDVACPGAFAVDWIEELSLEGITGGCGGTNFCPDDPVRRDQMAVFLLKASLGADHVPPTATGTVFADVPAGAFAADWIENLYALNVTGGCLTSPLRYCPSNTNNRQQMAVFITKAFGLQ